MSEAELTCPQCCYNSLEKIGRNRWRCGNCGTSFDFNKLRKSLCDLVAHEFTEDFIHELLGNPDLKRHPKLGERGWKWTGRYGILYTLHTGNTWHLIVRAKIRTQIERELKVIVEECRDGVGKKSIRLTSVEGRAQKEKEGREGVENLCLS